MIESILHSGVHWGLVNFAIFVGLLFFFLKKPVKDFWESRRGEIKFEIEEAQKLGREAKLKNEELKKRLSGLDAEAKDRILSLEREGEMQKKQLMEEGKRRADRMKEDSVRIMEQETRKARESLKEQVVLSAVETAEKMIRENIRGEDQKKLTDEYLAGLERQAAV